MKKTISIIVLTILTFAFAQNVLAIGMVSEPIIIKDVLRSSEVTDKLILFNSGDEEVVYQLKDEGEIAGWASFYQINDTNLENSITQVQISAKSRLDVIVKFTIPENVPNGEYNGEIVFMTTPSEKETDKIGVSVFESIGRKVSITVTDKEILDFKTAIIPLKYGVKKGEPLEIKIIYDNQGNVLIQPDIQLKITRDDKTVFNAIFPYPENENPVKPFERKELASLIEWQTTGQENGLYKAEIQVLLNNEVYQEEDFRFSIGASGIVAGIKTISLRIFWPIIIALAVILLGLAVVLFSRKIAHRKPNNS